MALNLGPGDYSSAHFVYLPYLTHSVQGSVLRTSLNTSEMI